MHRDLKPANIMLAGSSVTRSGQSMRASGGRQATKLLDFGLAKWAASEQAAPLAAQPTRLDVTAQGTLIGTLQYMAPEQVEGREADTRTDIFAFGAVLYEMLTGKKAFEGKSQASLIGAIMKAEPRPISHAQPLTPAVLEQIVARCLVKDPDERWQHAATLKRKLQWIVRNRGVGTAVVETPRRRWLDVAVAAAIAVLLAAVSVPAYLYWRGSADPEPVQFRHTISGLSETDFADLARRPDDCVRGQAGSVRRVVALHAPGQGAGIRQARRDGWSGAAVLVAGRPVHWIRGRREVAESAGVRWRAERRVRSQRRGRRRVEPSQGGTIVFGSSKGLFAVSAEGGQAAPITELGKGETGHFWPVFLPDGRSLAFLAWSNDVATRALFTGTLDSKERTQLVAAESNPVYAASGTSRSAASGYLFFHRKGHALCSAV